MGTPAARRPRLARRALQGTGRVPRTASVRERVAEAFERLSPHERVLLALLLVERLTPAEAAEAMGMPIERLSRAARELLAELRLAVAGLGLRRIRRRDPRRGAMRLGRAS